MSWSFSDLIQFAQDLVGADTGNDSATESSFGEFTYNMFEDNGASEYGASNLSIDEVRQSYDEYEDILRS